jgi:hypothetical protein
MSNRSDLEKLTRWYPATTPGGEFDGMGKDKDGSWLKRDDVLAFFGGLKPEAFRERLPDTRDSIIRSFVIARPNHRNGDLKMDVTVGLYPDGRPGEIFIRSDYTGSFASGALDAVAMALSMAWQYGVPFRPTVEKLKGMRFEPQGATGDPKYGIVTSPLDYVAKWLLNRFGKEAGEAEPEKRDEVLDTQVEVACVALDALDRLASLEEPVEAFEATLTADEEVRASSPPVSDDPRAGLEVAPSERVTQEMPALRPGEVVAVVDVASIRESLPRLYKTIEDWNREHGLGFSRIDAMALEAAFEDLKAVLLKKEESGRERRSFHADAVEKEASTLEDIMATLPKTREVIDAWNKRLGVDASVFDIELFRAAYTDQGNAVRKAAEDHRVIRFLSERDWADRRSLDEILLSTDEIDELVKGMRSPFQLARDAAAKQLDKVRRKP